MKKIKLYITLIAVSSAITTSHAASWGEWASWAKSFIPGQNQEATSENNDGAAPKFEIKQDNDTQKEEDKHQLLADTKEAMFAQIEKDGFKFFPTIATDVTENKALSNFKTLWDKKDSDRAVAYFTSLIRDNEPVAIQLLEKSSADPRKKGSAITEDQRLAILMDSPSLAISYLLTAINNHYAGKELTHWGYFDLYSTYNGWMKKTTAVIKGNAVAAQYIQFIAMHNVNNQDDYNTRGARLVEVLGQTGDNLVSLLVHKDEDVAAKIGSENKDTCFGVLRTKGVCEETTPAHIQWGLLAALIDALKSQNWLSDSQLVEILETEKDNKYDRFLHLTEVLSQSTLHTGAAYLDAETREKMGDTDDILDLDPEAPAPSDNLGVAGQPLQLGAGN